MYVTNQQTIIDNDEILCMQSQPSHRNHGRYNKLAHEDHAITLISSARHPPEEEEFSTNLPSSPVRKKFLEGLFGSLPSNPLILTERYTNTYL